MKDKSKKDGRPNGILLQILNFVGKPLCFYTIISLVLLFTMEIEVFVMDRCGVIVSKGSPTLDFLIYYSNLLVN